LEGGCEIRSAITRHNTNCIKQGNITREQGCCPWSPPQGGARDQSASARRGLPSKGEALELHHQPHHLFYLTSVTWLHTSLFFDIIFFLYLLLGFIPVIYNCTVHGQRHPQLFFVFFNVVRTRTDSASHTNVYLQTRSDARIPQGKNKTHMKRDENSHTIQEKKRHT
jgi:hypothetical protein